LVINRTKVIFRGRMEHFMDAAFSNV